MKAKVTPKGGIKVIVMDNNGQPKVLGTIPVWENPTSVQKWVMENSGAEANTQLVYVAKEEEFSIENDVSIKVNTTKTINSKYTVKVKEV